MIDVQIEQRWKNKLATVFQQSYFSQIVDFLKKEKQAGKTIYPSGKLIFNAFLHTPFDKLKVVILGQDPYHNPQQAHGLCFSVPEGIAPPPSLINIFKELQTDIGIEQPLHGCLEQWANQGVLLLNAALTVEENKPMSHSQIGWYHFTDSVIKMISDEKYHVVFMLWGKFAQGKESLIDQSKHLILKAAHPSPLSAHNGFFGCKHFSKANEWLNQHGMEAIDWRL